MIPKTPLLNRFIAEDSLLYFSFNHKQLAFTEYNKAFTQFFQGVNMNGDYQQFVSLIVPDDLEHLQIAYEKLKPGELSGNIEFRLLLQQRTYYLQLNALIDETDPDIISGRLMDITEQKLYQENLVEYTNKKNAVLNIISHDLAGPLGTIQMLSSLLQGHFKANTEERIMKIINMIETNSKRGIKMIQEFIKKEFLESIGVELQLKRCDLAQKIQQLLDEYKASELHLNLSFNFKCDQAEIYAAIDEVKFMQAVNNLISNSIKFTQDEGTITIGLETKQKKVLLSVADNGIGIPKQFHATLFDKFNPAGRMGLRGEHSVGLGMSIIKTIVDWHKGKIWFESEEQKGTTFFIELNQS